MCKSCFDLYTDGELRDSPAIRGAAERIRSVYAGNAVGGGLHTLLDDWNLEDEFLTRYAFQDDTPEQVAAEEACLAAMRPLSEAERASALYLAQYVLPPAEERDNG